MDVELQDIHVDGLALENQVFDEAEAKRGREAELKKLQTELDEAEKAYEAARLAAADRSWSSWLKYALYTPSSKASNAEIVSFVGSRVALLNGVSNLGFMVAYLLPGMTATNVYQMDLASNSTLPVQVETDRANYEYYWSNVASYGTQALVNFGAALMSLSYSYKSMRERIEADKKAEFVLAQEKLAQHKRWYEEANDRTDKQHRLEELLRLAKKSAEDRAKELKAIGLEIKDLKTEVEKARSKSEELGGELKTAKDDIDARKLREAELQLRIKELESALDKARQDADAKTRLSEQQDREVARLTKELNAAGDDLTQCKLRSQVLETQLKESESKQQILQNVMDQLTAISKNVDLARTQLDGVKSTVEQTNSLLGADEK